MIDRSNIDKFLSRTDLIACKSHCGAYVLWDNLKNCYVEGFDNDGNGIEHAFNKCEASKKHLIVHFVNHKKRIIKAFVGRWVTNYHYLDEDLRPRNLRIYNKENDAFQIFIIKNGYKITTTLGSATYDCPFCDFKDANGSGINKHVKSHMGMR